MSTLGKHAELKSSSECDHLAISYMTNDKTEFCLLCLVSDFHISSVILFNVFPLRILSFFYYDVVLTTLYFQWLRFYY